MHVIITDQGLDPAVLCKQLPKDEGTGAVANFTGYMRNHNAGRQVEAMLLDHYPAMTEQALNEIGEDAKQRWPISNVLVAHRVGAVIPGDVLVYVEVHSAHRQDAFDACNYIMDTLKTQAPFWKKESTDNGEHWVEQRDSDMTALNKWQQPDV